MAEIPAETLIVEISFRLFHFSRHIVPDCHLSAFIDNRVSKGDRDSQLQLQDNGKIPLRLILVIPCAGGKTIPRHMQDVPSRIILKKETRSAAGFLRIIICWFFDLRYAIEKSLWIWTKDNRIYFPFTKFIFTWTSKKAEDGRKS